MEIPGYIQGVIKAAESRGFDHVTVRLEPGFHTGGSCWAICAEDMRTGAISCRWVAEHFGAPPSGDPAL